MIETVRFDPARKAHTGILVTGLAELAERLAAGGVEVTWDDEFPGHDRFYAADPFGNRLEFLQPRDWASGQAGTSSRRSAG